MTTSPIHLPADEGQPLDGSARERVIALVEAHHDLVWRALRRLGVLGADTDDAAQQVFLIALRKIDRITPGKERSFLYGVALRVARARRRRSRARRMDPLPEEGLPSDAASPHEMAAQVEAWRRVEIALDALKTDLREVFVLHEIEELSGPAIAELLGIPTGTVASRLRRARAAFRAALNPDEREDER